MSSGFPMILRNLNGSWYPATSAHTLSTLFTRPVHEFHALGFSALSIKGDKKGTLAPTQLMAIVIGWENGAIFNCSELPKLAAGIASRLRRWRPAAINWSTGHTQAHPGATVQSAILFQKLSPFCGLLKSLSQQTYFSVSEQAWQNLDYTWFTYIILHLYKYIPLQKTGVVIVSARHLTSLTWGHQFVIKN